MKAAEELGRLGDRRAVEPLIDALGDDDELVRVRAAKALGILGDPRALPPLQKLYRRESEASRSTIGEAMERVRRGINDKME